MSFAFLAPLFLVGALAVAIPVYVHLTHRERKDAVPFPSLMFLRRVPYRTVRRQRLRHWLLFLLRALAVLLLVAAFARPFVDRAALGPAVVGDGRDVVILLDHSASMAYGDRWSRGVDAARTTIDGLRAIDRATLVAFGDRADAVTPATSDRPILRNALAAIRPLAVGTKYAPALQLAHDVLEVSESPNREVVLITDFQRVGWTADAPIRMPDGTAVTVVDLSDADASNVAVTGVQLDRAGEGGDRLVVTARVTAASADTAVRVGVTLEIEGEAVESRQITVPAGNAASTVFAPITVPDRTVRGRVRVDGDALPYDDAFGFTVEQRTAIPLLILHHPDARAGEWLYLRQALSIGSAPPFGIEFAPATAIGPVAFDGRAVVVLYDAPVPGGDVGRSLRAFVEAGGGVLAVLGPRSGNAAWPPDARVLLGDRAGPTVDRDAGRGGTLSILDYRHPLFEPFSGSRGADFSAARFFRYRRWTPPDSAVVLARFDDGVPALAEMVVGGGRVLLWTAGAANRWNDLPLQPVFLPFVHQLARYAASYRPRPAWREAGGMIDLARDLRVRSWGGAGTVFGDEPGELIVEAPSGTRFIVDDASGYRLALNEHGFYRIRSEPEGIATLVAVNTAPSESDLGIVEPDVVSAAIAAGEADGSRLARLTATLTPTEKERRQALWWYVMVAALLLLLAETLIAGRLSGRRYRRQTVETRDASAVR
jgi:hypothetical protein